MYAFTHSYIHICTYYSCTWTHSYALSSFAYLYRSYHLCISIMFHRIHFGMFIIYSYHICFIYISFFIYFSFTFMFMFMFMFIFQFVFMFHIIFMFSWTHLYIFHFLYCPCFMAITYSTSYTYHSSMNPLYLGIGINPIGSSKLKLWHFHAKLVNLPITLGTVCITHFSGVLTSYLTLYLCTFLKAKVLRFFSNWNHPNRSTETRVMFKTTRTTL